ncbi:MULTISPECIES: tetratricopeptide repeat protein [unclassified Oceanobacillus]|uniref:tetratricopeptide repeat protein n=1 Tax=unclassified Oceanobacillus TaxID=2630292 RepID=UPI00300E5D7E
MYPKKGMIVTMENKLIMKSYYQTIIDENEKEKEHPIKILGEMYMEEMKKEQPELSAIRFAQGEVYFLNQDYEAAIYKWQHPLDKSLIPWGQKNIADAHMEMGLLEYAEKFYKEVETDSVTLKTEVMLQLFSLYIQQDQMEKSVDIIKKAVQLNPDYADVTEIAKRYFESIKDWDSAIELAVNEAIRTESLSWFEVLEGYANLGVTSNHDPAYFNNVLVTLYSIDKYHFERLTDGLWRSFKQSEYYFRWLEEVNQLLLYQNMEASYNWRKLPSLFKEGYYYLISGRFLINDVSNLVQDHLTNWLAVSSTSDRLISSAAILAWNELFPSAMDTSLIQEAEQAFKNASPDQSGKEEGIKLLDSIKVWAEKEGLLEGLTEFMGSRLDEYKIEEVGPTRIREVIKDALAYISDQQAELENVILREIDWSEEVLTELHDFHQEILDVEKDKANIMISSFRDLKNKLMEKAQVKLPELLKNCSDLVKEDSDFSKLHLVLNEEMNNRMAQYMEKEVLAEFKSVTEEWLDTCEREFQESQMLFDEVSENINQQFKQEKVVLSGDFKILDDWKRDIERISRGLLRFEEVNILLRNNPSQLLLKGAGKLLAPLSKNKEMLLGRYRDYIENADYSEVAEEMTKTFTQQLQFFEESIGWDVNKFFFNPQEKLHRIIEEVQAAIEEKNGSLNEMREQPEIYQDPLFLFELKLRHYDLMNGIDTMSYIGRY